MPTISTLSIVSQEAMIVACTSVVWLLALGTSIAFYAIFATASRIKRILKYAKKNVDVSKRKVRDTLTPSVVLLTRTLFFFAAL
jgi:hypothetical protein